ncbi:hypothetical protein Ssi03_13410 [Sphaerisporangium siamense]|uniref:Uncharacterized protein n=1 Tax=Sphaerisporangium siamense TaxID=795645 RepID=A0A7W7DBE1_9ACTN|nr:hypothetical protein [Sphaerisporangium siamense]MBB4702890.1 hypothetical protein [Sphaerisporangium siamense]GII83351.1 hypothetical protein Ssi03_13410 [Sphaerisporangium siamense]
MTSEELANEVMAAVVAVQGRILGVGQEQYDEGSQQKFELMSLQQLVDYAMEEAEDGIAYNVMLRYKLKQLKAAINQAFAGYTANAAARHAKPAPSPAPDVYQMPANPPKVVGPDPTDILYRIPGHPAADNFGGFSR